MPGETASFQTLPEWLAYLESLNPSHIELGLGRGRNVLKRMSLSHSARVITVAGTNGKGSTVRQLERMLSARGCRVSAYTSPHIFHFRERIRILEKEVSDAQLVSAFQAVASAKEHTHLTYFEYTTLAAAYLFSQELLDFWVLEVGLGGRLDAVNLFDPDVALVTNIGLDHTDWLGDTLEAIGAEKAGIYRKEKPALFASSERPVSIDQTVENVTASPVFFGKKFGVENDEFWWADKKPFRLNVAKVSRSLLTNLAGSLAVLSVLGLIPSKEDLEAIEGLKIPGRVQSLAFRNSQLLIDVAHNARAVTRLSEYIAQNELNRLTAVVGVMSDKLSPELFLPMIDFVEYWVLVRPETQRSATTEDIENTLLELQVPEENIRRCESISELDQYLQEIETAVIYGSFYTVGECLSVLGVSLD